MEKDFITLEEFCIHHKAEPDFVNALAENGLLTLVEMNRQKAILYEQLPDLECYIRWHYELEINLEGIDAMRYLLEKVKSLQHELREVRSRLTDTPHTF